MMKRKHEDLEALLDMLKSFPEQEAIDLLVRIRAGVHPSLLVEQVRHGSVLMSLSNHGSSGRCHDGLERRSHSSSSS